MQAFEVNCLPIETAPFRPYGRDLGAVYSYERRIRGWRTGMRDCLVHLTASTAAAELSLAEFAAGLGAFDVATVQVLGLDAPLRLEDPPGATAAELVPLCIQQVLPLGQDYSAFLRSLGRHTRRNIGVFRRRAAAEGIAFDCAASLQTPLDPALYDLAQRNMPFALRHDVIANQVRFTLAQPRQFHVGLRHPRHGAFAVSGGFIEGEIAYMVYQLNDKSCGDLNPSLLLRSCLVEHLVAAGARYLAFVRGCSGLLLNACEAVASFELTLVRRSLPPRIKHFVSKAIAGPESRRARLPSVLVPL
ncbi:MAG TPA: hypothetical protein VFA12_06665 [Stellaceae bacterium]|nr:hypothetical protein [Stellaceae bacterium]